MKIIFGILAVCITFSCSASIEQSMEQAFKKMGLSGSASNSGSIKNQSVGNYTNGNLYIRNSVYDTNIVHIELPKLSVGCNGIDFYKGSYSLINKENFKQLYENIKDNAPVVAWKLVQEELSPHIQNITDKLNEYISKANQFNLNSCEIAEKMVGTAYDQIKSYAQNTCSTTSIGKEEGEYTDIAASRKGCSINGNSEKSQNRPENKDKFLVAGNIAWKSSRKIEALRANIDLSELLMSLTGTITISLKDGSQNVLPSLASDKDLVSAILRGGKADIYKCDSTKENECLNPYKKTKTISFDDSFVGKAQIQIRSIINKIYEDNVPLTEEEKSFISSSSLPLLKILTVAAAYYKKHSVYDAEHYSNVVGLNILEGYLTSILEQMKAGHHSSQYPEGIRKRFYQLVNDALTNIRRQFETLSQQQAMNYQIIKETQLMEAQLKREDFFSGK